jgi:hypothetical protein
MGKFEKPAFGTILLFRRPLKIPELKGKLES